MASQLNTPKGTRDFAPAAMAARHYVIATLRTQFERFGFAPIETPAMETLDVLTGKYGDEGEQLIFKILNSGDYLSKIPEGEIEKGSTSLVPHISEKALRYDLTVPFARFVVQHQNELPFPFKRYQIQPVWRADRPQKGRFREFTQCDVDVVGTDSLVVEAELCQLVHAALTDLGLTEYTLRINHRQVLAGYAEALGIEQSGPLFVAIDKMDKVGWNGVRDELEGKGYRADQLDKLMELLHLRGTPEHVLGGLETIIGSTEAGKKGIAELREVLSLVASFGPTPNLAIDPTLARGLTYYTGCIFELVANNVSIGSIGGGGRYADLTGIFGKPDLPGVGFSFGLDRLMEALDQEGLLKGIHPTPTRILIVHFGGETLSYALKVVTELRVQGIQAEVYPDEAKLGKQLTYASKRAIPLAGIVGEEEAKAGTVMLKNLENGAQTPVPLAELAELLN